LKKKTFQGLMKPDGITLCWAVLEIIFQKIFLVNDDSFCNKNNILVSKWRLFLLSYFAYILSLLAFLGSIGMGSG